MRQLAYHNRTIAIMAFVLLCLLFSPWRPAETAPAVSGSSSADAPLAPPEVLRKIEPELLHRLLSRPDGTFDVIVDMEAQAALPQAQTLRGMAILSRRQLVTQNLKSTAASTQAPLLSVLAARQSSGAVSRVTPFWVFNGLAVTGRLPAVLEIAQRGDVRDVRLDRVIHLTDSWDGPEPQAGAAPASPSSSSDVEWNIQQIRADQVWNTLRIDGSGVVVGSMDTGVDWQHPALFSSYRGNTGKGFFDHTPSWFCATTEGYTTPTDLYGHGTHTMGTIIGHTSDHPAIGVAPGARWISAKVFDDNGDAQLSWIHAGFQWMLDPGGTGNPALVPDVVNNSWGSLYGDDDTFLSDVQAWRAAGIVPVFAAGNEGPIPYSIDSPGSFHESIAVGATDSEDYVTGFSSRGPSAWNEVKPNVSAPGLDVNSAAPGGGYAVHSGTSMSTPHVTGLVALLLQADPSLSINEIEDLLTSSAVPRGSPIPNNDFGWGRVDALQAVATASQAGHIKGRIRSATDHAPITYAAIDASALPPQTGSGRAAADASGAFELPLAAWRYDVTADAFGYYPATASGILVVSGTETTIPDFQLSPLPTGRLQGFVRELGTDRPLSATIAISGTPIVATTSPDTGAYSVNLPSGTYTIRATSRGHRIGIAQNVTISVHNTTHRSFSLAAAPTLLFVDSGAWHNGSEAAYFRAALDDLNYDYDVWTIHNLYGTNRDVPSAADLKPYGVVIWSCPEDSPGYADAWQSITPYLQGGGKLFLTGQDIGYWDHPDGGVYGTSNYTQFLDGQFITDDSGSRTLMSQSGSFLAGLSLSLNGTDSADNQTSPDAIALKNESWAAALAHYDAGILGGLEVHACQPYRLVYFSFGFEGINGRATRREVMDRVLTWLGTPPAPAAAQITPAWQTALQSTGQSITYTVYVHNQNADEATDVYHLSLGAHAWNSVLMTDTITVAPCATGTVTVRVDVPADAAWHVSDAVTITAQSILSPTIRSTGVISTQTPAPILLVDHDRWYDVESTYRAALDQNGLPYDFWNVGWTGPMRMGAPSADLLRMHPIIVWFTGYDWFSPLSASDESHLGSALDAGSRLWLISPDYLDVRGLNPFGSDYLGVASYSPLLTTTEASGVVDDLIGNLLGPYTLAYPYPNRSEAIAPQASAHSVFLGSHDQPVAVRNEGGKFRTTFFSFPVEAIKSAGDRAAVARQAVGELSWLGGTTFTADQSAVLPGATVAFTLRVPNNGPQPVSAAITNTVPISLTFVPGSLSPASAVFDQDTHTIKWAGPLSTGERATIRYQAVISTALPAATRLVDPVQIGYSEHHVQFDRFWTLNVAAPDLSGSRMFPNETMIEPGDPITYTIVLRNDGLSAASSATLTNAVPSGTTYHTGTIQLIGGGTITDTNGLIQWGGSLAPGEQATLIYWVDVTTAQRGSTIQNVAFLRDEYNPVRRLRVDVQLGMLRQWLPMLLKTTKP